MRRAVTLVIASSLAATAVTLGGCGSASSTQSLPPATPAASVALTQATPPPSEPPTTAKLLADARAARDKAAAARAPTLAEIESASEDAVTDVLQRWASARRDATHEAVRAYDEALRTARDPAEQAEIHGEIAGLWLGLEDDVQAAILASTPRKYRSEPSVVNALQADWNETLKPLRDRAQPHVDACQQIVREAPGAANAACVASTEKLAQASGGAARVAPVTAVASASSEPRAVVPTTRPKPCTFKGTLVTRGAVYADATGSAVLLPVTVDSAIEVESLDMPEQRNGRYKVVVNWPAHVEGYLDAQEPPFVLKRQVELVPEAAWVAQGERVAADESRGPTVRVSRAFGGGASGGSVKKPMPESLDRRLFCYDLELATKAPGPHAPQAGSEGATRLVADAAVPLLAEPNGKEVARVVGDEVKVVERFGDFAHVAGEGAFTFDGWVKSVYLQTTK